MKVCFSLVVTFALLLGTVSGIRIAQEKLETLRQDIEERLSAANTPRRNDHRSLQTPDLSDPCTALDTTATFGISGLLLWPPSFYQSCAESIVVNPTNMLLHLQSLKDIFQQYHCFYDIAKDPSNSDPSSHQPELGNTIFDADGGAVNLEEGLEDIRAKVLAEGASMATFWEIEELFSRLYDGHVDAPDVEQDFYLFSLLAVPQRLVDGDYRINTDFSYDENTRLQLKLTYFNVATDTAEELDIDTINGQSVHDFIIDLANNPAVRLNYQSVGARVNDLLQKSAIFGGPLILGKPLDVLPDTFQVTYIGGGEETYVTGAVASNAWVSFFEYQTVGEDRFVVFDRTLAEAFVNQPGEQFDAYLRAAVAIDDASNDRSRRMSPADKGARTLTSRRQQTSGSQFVFDKEITPGVGAFSIQDGYAVMKLESFVVDGLDVFYLWTNITEAALQSGVTKLVIDLSSNGGGIVSSAYLLLFLLFPEVDLTWFQDQWDINFNTPMREFVEALLPIIEAVQTEFPDIPDSDFEARINAFTQSDFSIYQIAADAMLELCQDADPLGQQTEFQCAQVSELSSLMTNFVVLPTLGTYSDLFVSLYQTLIQYTPLSVVLELVQFNQPNIIGDLVSIGPQTIIRGGVESNTTAKFNLESLETLQILKTAAESVASRPFDEYIFVSNGLSASAGAIVPFEAAQLYKNRDRTGATTKVTLCGYGGTGNPDEMVLSSIPASVQGVHLEDPIIGDAALSLFIYLLPTTLSNIDEIYREARQYSETVPVPPYFGDTLPRMPVVNFYDRSMEPGALPLQFVRIPLDAYIPQVFTDVTFEDSSDLQALYEEVANLSSASSTPAPVTPTSPTPAPVSPTAPTSTPPTPAPVTALSPTPAPATPTLTTPAPSSSAEARFSIIFMLALGALAVVIF